MRAALWLTMSQMTLTGSGRVFSGPGWLVGFYPGTKHEDKSEWAFYNGTSTAGELLLRRAVNPYQASDFVAAWPIYFSHGLFVGVSGTPYASVFKFVVDRG